MNVAVRVRLSRQSEIFAAAPGRVADAVDPGERARSPSMERAFRVAAKRSQTSRSRAGLPRCSAARATGCVDAESLRAPHPRAQE
jgi:hypothetical protein